MMAGFSAPSGLSAWNSTHAMTRGSSSFSFLRRSRLAFSKEPTMSSSASSPSGWSGRGEEDPDRDVSRLYRRVIPVLQYLDPADHAVRKDRPDVLLDTGGPGLRHVIFLTCQPYTYNTCKLVK
jgi:hypothetical protein